jgi:hypothetical protein
MYSEELNKLRRLPGIKQSKDDKSGMDKLVCGLGTQPQHSLFASIGSKEIQYSREDPLPAPEYLCVTTLPKPITGTGTS